MAIKVIKPTWESIGSGLKISREGTLLLEFAASVGPQQYDWTKKEVRLRVLAAAGAVGTRDHHVAHAMRVEPRRHLG